MNNIDPWVLALIIGGAILLGVIIFVIVMAVSTVGRIGLIRGTKLADEDDNALLTFSGLFNDMKPYFWRVLGLNLLIGVAFFFIILAIVFVVIFGTIFTLGIGLICLIPLICVLVPVFWVLTTFVEMANVAVVVEDLNVIEALQRGWQVFKDNLGSMVLMGLVLILGGFIVGMLVALPLILTMIPLMVSIIAFASGDSTAFAGAGAAIAGLCCLVYFPVLILLSGIVRAYISSAWTLTFLRLTQGPAVSQEVDLLPEEPTPPVETPEVVETAPVEPEAQTLVSPKAEESTNSDDALPEDF
jgi:hypothetical protein